MVALCRSELWTLGIESKYLINLANHWIWHSKLFQTEWLWSCCVSHCISAIQCIHRCARAPGLFKLYRITTQSWLEKMKLIWISTLYSEVISVSYGCDQRLKSPVYYFWDFPKIIRDAQMEKRVDRVIRACVELKENNPIPERSFVMYHNLGHFLRDSVKRLIWQCLFMTRAVGTIATRLPWRSILRFNCYVRGSGNVLKSTESSSVNASHLCSEIVDPAGAELDIRHIGFRKLICDVWRCWGSE